VHALTTPRQLLLDQFVEDGGAYTFNRYDIAVRYLAAEELVSKTQGPGIALYKKMQQERLGMSDHDADMYVKKFKLLIRSIQANGYNYASPIIVNKHLRVIDGAHRLACILLFANVSKFEILIREDGDPRYGIDWFENRNFSPKELNLVNKTWDLIKFNYRISEDFAKKKVADIISLKEAYTASKQLLGRGDFYQSCPLLKLTGQRSTLHRLEKYSIESVINANSQLLDIGCNTGFISLVLSRYVKHVDAIDINADLVSVGNEAKRILDIPNCTLYNISFEDFNVTAKYDIILSLVVDFYTRYTFIEFCDKVKGLLNPGGYFLLESGDVTTVDKNFDKKIKYLLYSGFSLKVAGEIKDDNKILRRFILAKKALED